MGQKCTGKVFKLNQIDYNSAPVHFWFIWYATLTSPFFTSYWMEFMNLSNILKIFQNFHSNDLKNGAISCGKYDKQMTEEAKQ